MVRNKSIIRSVAPQYEFSMILIRHTLRDSYRGQERGLIYDWTILDFD